MAPKPLHADLLTEQFRTMADWLLGVIEEGNLRGLSIVITEEVEHPDIRMPVVPRHAFFVVPGGAASLAGGLLAAITELGQHMLPPPPPPAEARGAVFPMAPPDPEIPEDAEDHEDAPGDAETQTEAPSLPHEPTKH